MKWWNEYGPYEIQSDGLPHFGQVVFDFIKRKKWSVEQFGSIYGRAIKNKPYSKMRIYQMVNTNSFPSDPSRRYLIAKLIDIPAFLLGASSLEKLLQTKTAPYTSTPKALDLQEYLSFITDCWQQNRAATIQTTREIGLRLNNLHARLIYGSSNERANVARLLAMYQIFLAHVARDKQNYQTSLNHLNKAVRLAKEYKHITLLATVLLQKGITYKELVTDGEYLPAINKAVTNFAAALSLKNEVDSQLRGSILLGAGDAKVYLASVQQDFKSLNAALHLEDNAFKLTDVDQWQNTEHFVRFNSERFHLGKASTLIEAHLLPDTAIEHLDLLFRIPHSGIRRRAYLYALYSQAYLQKDLYPMATSYAVESITLAREIDSTVNVMRVSRIYDRMKTTNYGNSTEVAELGLSVLQAQHPNLFERSNNGI